MLNLKKIIKFLDSKLLISLINLFSLNKIRISKERAINEVLKEIDEYFKTHYIKKYIYAEEAKLMQKYYFRNKPYFKNLLKELDEKKSSDEIIKYLSEYYLNDMAPDFNPAFLIFFREFCRFKYSNFVKNFKVEVDDNTIKFLKNIQGKNPIFYLPNHVSNADHIPIGFALNRKKLFHPVIVAGANLYRGASKYILPKANVEKLRRDFITDTFKWLQNPIYKLCFVKFNNYLWKNNEPYMFYIEGGRSRDGTISEPKYGIISEIFSFINNYKRNAYFIPITISYTIVPEDIELYEATKGKNITEKDLFSHLTELNKEYKKFKNPYIYVKILNPIEVNPDSNISYKEFAIKIIKILKENVKVTPTYLLASIIKNHEKISLKLAENEYNKKNYIEAKGNFHYAVNIFKEKKFIKVENNEIKIISKELINQYANRIKFLT